MPKIVFWSPLTKMSGNTYSALAVSTLMGMEEDINAILLHAHWQGRKIQTYDS